MATMVDIEYKIKTNLANLILYVAPMYITNDVIMLLYVCVKCNHNRMIISMNLSLFATNFEQVGNSICCVVMSISCVDVCFVLLGRPVHK